MKTVDKIFAPIELVKALMAMVLAAFGMYAAMYMLFFHGIAASVAAPTVDEAAWGFVKTLLAGPTALVSVIPLVSLWENFLTLPE